MKDKINRRLEEITTTTLIVGIDIAKSVQWARFVDYRGKELWKAISFTNDKCGFENIVTIIEEICNNKVMQSAYDNVIIGMEPTGHYWKPLANYLSGLRYRVVCVNPHHTKKVKELDDNSQTASDRKDAIIIARLIKDGRYFEPYMPQDIYAELRVLAVTRISVMSRSNAVKNSITVILDEYFPEIWSVWKKPLVSRAARQILKNCPFPALIKKMGEAEILTELKRGVKKSVGIKKAQQLIKAAEASIGVGYGLESTRLRLNLLLNELEQIENSISEIESSMERMLIVTGYSERLLSIKGVGVVTAASFLGELGDPLRFQSARQISNYAGYNLIEDSSGKSKSGTCISKRGRSQLRSLLYRMALTMVAKNEEMKKLHEYLTSRANNPLKKKQSLVVISKKIITVIYSLLKKQATYDPALVLGAIRREMMTA